MVWEVIVMYGGGMDGDLDSELKVIASKCEGKSVGSGCCLFGNYTRDVQFEFQSEEKARSFEAEVEQRYPDVGIEVWKDE